MHCHGRTMYGTVLPPAEGFSGKSAGGEATYLVDGDHRRLLYCQVARPPGELGRSFSIPQAPSQGHGRSHGHFRQGRVSSSRGVGRK